MSRLVCKSENYEMDLTLDVNVELLPVETGFKFSVELATTLNLDGTVGTDKYVATVLESPKNVVSFRNRHKHFRKLETTCWGNFGRAKPPL